MSSQLQWDLIKNNSCFLMKRNNVEFSKEANNLKSKNCFKYNGLVHKKTVGVVAVADGKGVTLVTKRVKHQNKPAKHQVKSNLKGSPRAVISTIRKTLRKNNYRKDLKMAAIRRACAILKSQKTSVEK